MKIEKVPILNSQKNLAHQSSYNFILAGILSAVFSSLAWIPEQEAVLRLTPLIAGSLAPLAAGMIIFCVFPSTRKIPFALIKEYKRDFLLILFIRNTIGFLIFVTALLYTSSIKVMFLTKMEPYVVLFWHWLLYREKIQQKDCLLLLVHIFGALLLSLGADFSFSIEQWGDLLIFVGLLASASVYRPGRVLAQKVGSLKSTMLVNFCSGLLMLPFALFFDHEVLFHSPQALSGLGFLLMTVCLYYICSTSLWFYSLSGAPAWINSALRALGPVVAAPVAWIFFGRALDGVQLLGAGLVVVTSVLLVVGVRRGSN